MLYVSWLVLLTSIVWACILTALVAAKTWTSSTKISLAIKLIYDRFSSLYSVSDYNNY